MDRRVKRRLDLGKVVRDFCRRHPVPGPGYLEAMKLLDERVTRLEAMATQQVTGISTRLGSTVTKAELRRIIREDHLRHLVRMARGAQAQDPTLAARFRLPYKKINGAGFIAAAKAMMEQAASCPGLFIGEGMPATFLQDLKDLIGDYQKALAGQHSGLSLHIGARAEMKAVSKQVMHLIQRFDGIYLKAFERDPETRAVWLAVRHEERTREKVSESRAEGEEVQVKPAA